MTLNSTTQAFLVSLVALVGLIVLVAMGKVAADAGVPIIAALGGAHVGVGAALSLPTAAGPAAGRVIPVRGSQGATGPPASSQGGATGAE